MNRLGRSISLIVPLLAAVYSAPAAAETKTVSANVHDYVLGRDIDVVAEITLPRATNWPVAFVLHGCDGVTQWSKPALERRSKFYADRGYATIILDSWKPRHITELCVPRDEQYLALADPANRVADIEAVTAKLAHMTGFNGNVLVDGLSHGGWTAFSILGAEGDEPLQASLIGVVAWYPPCAALDPASRVPTLIFAGSDDRHPATPPEACVEAGARYEWVETLVLKGATHAFDYPTSLGAVGPAGRIAYSASSTEQAYNRLGEWLIERGLVP